MKNLQQQFILQDIERSTDHTPLIHDNNCRNYQHWSHRRKYVNHGNVRSGRLGRLNVYGY